MKLPWECENCGYHFVDSAFFTYDKCPRCESECIYHGDMIEED